MTDPTEDLVRKVAIEVCCIKNEDPYANMVCNVVDRLPPDCWKDRVDSQGSYRWVNWEGRAGYARDLIRLIQREAVSGN